MITRKDPIASEWLGPNDQTPIPEEDFWEGERWELVGKSLKFALPALALLAVGIGFFASRIYNEGAECVPSIPTLLYMFAVLQVCRPALMILGSACSSYLVQGAEDRPAQIVSAEELGF